MGWVVVRFYADGVYWDAVLLKTEKSAEELQSVLDALSESKELKDLSGEEYLEFLKSEGIIKDYTALGPVADEHLYDEIDEVVNNILEKAPKVMTSWEYEIVGQSVVKKTEYSVPDSVLKEVNDLYDATLIERADLP